MRQAWEAGNPSLATVPGAEEHWELVKRYLEASWRWGREHAGIEVSRLLADELDFNEADPPEPDRGLLPWEAILWILEREELAGKWNRQLDELVQLVIAEGMESGATLWESTQALQEVFPDFSRPRLENIARTEASSAYTNGRIRTFTQPDSRVAALQFSAILDNRTTVICRSRDGLILPINDPRLAEHTPPLHFQCRSTVVPITISQWRRLLRGDPRVLARVFGWVPAGGPRTLEAALNGWDSAAPPLVGFGGR